MPRFPNCQPHAKAIGKLLAQAALDPELRRRLHAAPEAELRRIGLPEQTVALFQFKIVSESGSKPAVVLPYRLNAARLERLDPDYLANIARTLPSSALN